jgi:hypothetical protein
VQEQHIVMTFYRYLLEDFRNSNLKIGVDVCFKTLNFSIYTDESLVQLYVRNSKGIASISSKENHTLIIDIDWLVTQPHWIINKIKYKLNLLPVLYARNCNVVNLNKVETQMFLLKNHPMGATSYHTSIGLVFKHQLVAVATFSKPRLWFINRMPYKSGEWIRMASKVGLVVVGASEKLLKHYINKSIDELNDIITYIDPDWSDEKTYLKMGFVPVSCKRILTIFVNIATFERSKQPNTNNLPGYFLKNKVSLKLRKIITEKPI